MTGSGSMPVTLRLTNTEQELLRKKCIDINKLLVKKGRQPLRDSELAHFLLLESIACIEVNESGALILEPK